MKVADFRAHVTLPGSGDGYGVNVVSKKKTRIPAEQWSKLSRKGVVLLSEDYKILRKSIQENCQFHQCKEIIGQFDGLFLAIDKALQAVPIP